MENSRIIGLAIIAYAFIQRCSNQQENPYTGRVQNINMTSEQEIAIGLQSAPQIAQEYGVYTQMNVCKPLLIWLGKN